MTREELLAERDRLIAAYGEWTFEVPLPHGVWTRGDGHIPHTRLKRVLQAVADLSPKPIASSRILDLGCLDGVFAIEFALHGATVVGIDIRKGHVEKAELARQALGLTNLSFEVGDVRQVSLQTHGFFDVVLCSGLLYHLGGQDALSLLCRLAEMSWLTVIDTHISLRTETSFVSESRAYHGSIYQEHHPGDDDEAKVSRRWGSLGNDFSFWFTRPSLLNALARAGFTSVHECFNPPHLNFGNPGLEHGDRCTFVAVRGQPLALHTSPTANELVEFWPEGSLAYHADSPPLFSVGCNDSASGHGLDSLSSQV